MIIIKDIIKEIEDAIDCVFITMCEQDYLSYILLIGRADVIEQKNNQKDFVIDYQLDRYNDEARENFYIRYLKRNYKKDGFNYHGEEGIDDLFIELMIYDHLWDSIYFLKSLLRIASITSGKGYIWSPTIPENGKWEFFKKDIIEPLKNNGFYLGNIIDKAYSTDIRNAFAHSLFDIDVKNRTIKFRPKRKTILVTFEDFQKKFLYSVILMNKMQNALETNHDSACELNSYVTQPFLTPDGIKVQVKSEIIKKGDSMRPRFRLIKSD